MKTWLKPVLIGSVSNLRFIIEVPNISLPHLEAWSHIKAWFEIITFEIEAPASIRGNTVDQCEMVEPQQFHFLHSSVPLTTLVQ